MKTAHTLWLWGTCALMCGACAPTDDPPAAHVRPVLTTPTGFEPPASASAAIPRSDPWENAWRQPPAAFHRGAPPGDDRPPPACIDDAVEDNDDLDSATPLTLMSVNWGFASFDQPSELHLCGGDDDWFEVDLEGHAALHAQIRDWARPYLFLRARIARVGLCGASCGEATLPDAPENTLTVEVYSKISGELITARTSTEGNVWITHGDARYRENYYIRITAPASASYDYILRMDMREDLFEDECEC